MTDQAAYAAFCHADKDGDCFWGECPQLKDYQLYCPIAKEEEKDPDWERL